MEKNVIATIKIGGKVYKTQITAERAEQIKKLQEMIRKNRNKETK